jgi:hypothetical protein
MKKYAVIVHLEIDEDEDSYHPATWQFDELIGSEVVGWDVLDVTDEPIERVRIEANNVEIIA